MIPYLVTANQEHLVLVIPSEALTQEFYRFINRAANTAPNLSPALKELIDLMTSGQIMQDYYSQVNQQRPSFKQD